MNKRKEEKINKEENNKDGKKDKNDKYNKMDINNNKNKDKVKRIMVIFMKKIKIII